MPVTRLGPGDRLLLCSNGIWEMLRPAEMRGILNLGLPAQQSCRLFVDAANLAGGADNIAVLILSTAEVAARRPLA